MKVTLIHKLNIVNRAYRSIPKPGEFFEGQEKLLVVDQYPDSTYGNLVTSTSEVPLPPSFDFILMFLNQPADSRYLPWLESMIVRQLTFGSSQNFASCFS